MHKALRALVREGRAVSDGHHFRSNPERHNAAHTESQPNNAIEQHPQSKQHHPKHISGPKLPAAFLAGSERHRTQRDEWKPQRGAKTWGEAREKPPEKAPKPLQREVVGLLTLKAEGYGFVTPLLGSMSRAEDLFVPPGKTGEAIDGDVVRLRTSKGRDGRPIGEVIEIVERRRQLALGAYRVRGKTAFVEPHDRKLVQPIAVTRDARFKDGDLVKVRLTESKNGQMFGTVLDELGARGQARFEILATAYSFGFADEFDAKTLAEAEQIPEQVRESDLAGRKDLRKMALVTIDGADARDFDDAVYVERQGDGYRLVVAIADVAHYVKRHTSLDSEALRRATSVYFPSTVLPMLPERLSNGICSLNPKVDRLCMVCDLTLDAQGTPQKADIYPAVMNSHARFTYDIVAEILEGKPVAPQFDALVPDILLAGKLAKLLTAQRFARGSIDFDLPEPKIVLDDQGGVKAIEQRPRNDAHRLVEEFMLAANEAVARFFEGRELPSVYRVHDQPDAERLEAFAALAAVHGHHLPEKLTPKALNGFLREIDGTPAQQALNSLLLRAMMQAHYTPENIGHYGLAAPTYLHFTSPIRRYPDLLVHRLLHEDIARHHKPLTAAERSAQEEELYGFAAQCSERERASMKAERDIDSFYAAVFMQGREGEEFNAIVTGVAEAGLFCAIQDPWVEGLIPIESLGDSVELDPEAHRLIVGRSGQSFGVGDAVRVVLKSSDPVKRRIGLELIEQVGPTHGKKRRDDRGDKHGKHREAPHVVAGEAISLGRAQPHPQHDPRRGKRHQEHTPVRGNKPAEKKEAWLRTDDLRTDDARPWLSEDDLRPDSKPVPREITALPKGRPQAFGGRFNKPGGKGGHGGRGGGGSGGGGGRGGSGGGRGGGGGGRGGGSGGRGGGGGGGRGGSGGKGGSKGRR
ncbi:MAG: ribonuclease R [Deltaproteobacteria bacterium]|nr:ribonuclease R [Deltaproteobacteria bacterium]